MSVMRKKVLGEDLPALGFGCMRLPLAADGSIDEKAVFDMVDTAMENGVNYFDTAYPYHGGMSERVVGKALERYPRDSFFLASKYPGHQIADSYDPAAIFEEQLQKCRVDYFDFYLLHNVCENSVDTYCDPRWGIVDYFVGQKKAGRIKHLGFSSHARPENLKKFLDRYGDVLEFCQIQLNYMDWDLQKASEKCAILAEAGKPVWVMEPVRGGKLASPDAETAEEMKRRRPEESCAAWAFRFLRGLDNIGMILSGMSDMSQMKDNIKTFSDEDYLTEDEKEFLFRAAARMSNCLPCTACRYCCDGCPMGLDIPLLIAAYNDLNYQNGMTVAMQMDMLPADKLPGACIGCGQCAAVCPQQIDIPDAMQKFSELLKHAPNWAQICRERDAANKANQGK